MSNPLIEALPPFLQNSVGAELVYFKLLILWPLIRICRRAGLSGLWALIVLVPFFGTALIAGVLAHAKWPNTPPLPARRR